MAIVRKKDLKQMPEAELNAKLKEIQKELAAERSTAKSSGKPSNAGRLKELRKVKARIFTFLTQKKVKAK